MQGPLGVGGMGQVFRARDTQLKRSVAIKVLYSDAARDEKRLRRLVAEARAASALNHPNILTVYGLGEQDGLPYIVTELVEGETLARLLERSPLTLERALDLTLQALAGLARAHETGIVHRDLKPANLMVTRDGFVKVLDFGLAKLTQPDSSDSDGTTLVGSFGLSVTEEGMIVGTAGYMSPEQVRGERVSAASDVFSMGTIVYEMVTGRNPFLRETPMDTFSAILRDHPPPLAEAVPEIPAAFSTAVDRALSKEQSQRFANAREMEFALASARESGPAVAAVTSAPTRPLNSLRSRSLRQGIAVAPIALLLAAGLFLWHRQRSLPRVESLAVLPFAESGQPQGDDFFGEGLTESLTNSLSRLSDLKVVPRSVAFRFRGRESDPGAVGRELKVAALLTGRVTHRADGVLVQTELVDVRTGAQLWGRQYTRSNSGLPGIENEIAAEVGDQLRGKLSDPQKRRLARRSTDDPEAYRLYLKGRYAWNRVTADGAKLAIEYFGQAIERDPGHALAHAGLAEAFAQVGYFGAARPRDTAPIAAAAARRAIELDPDLAEAHAALGTILFTYEWKWGEAEREFRKAIELDPGSLRAHHAYGLYLLARGRFEESRAQLGRAAELDPLSIYVSDDLGLPDFFAGQFERAVQQFQKTAELDPAFPNAHFHLGMVAVLRSRHAEALAEFEKALALAHNQPLEIPIRAYRLAVSGRRAEALGILDKLGLEKEEKRQPIVPVATASVFAFLGRHDDAFRWLEIGYADRFPEMVFMRVHPLLFELRGDPRFADLVRRIGL
ncbi:MAG TPA: protein kinase [Thermoanaerobaculia bacterium]|nr:protein kinase [Thermoanaerobaculia bacterium]